MFSQSILIVGNGVAGPTLATLLLLSPLSPQEKPHITILERSPSPRVEGQNVDVRGAGATVIRKLGLEKAIRAATTGEEGAQWVDSQNRVWAGFGADKSGKVQTGTSDIEIMRGRLAELLYKRSVTVSDDVKGQGGVGIEYIFGDYLEILEEGEEKMHVRFAKSGQRRSFDLVVGADGLQSSTRSLAFGKEGQDSVNPLGMYLGFFSMPRGTTDTQWRRWYRTSGRRGAMVRPGETMERSTAGMYVINDKDERLPQATVSGRKGVETQKELLEEYFRDAGWECQRLIKEMHAADDFYYDMVAQVKMDRWSKGRVVLLGDAGYCASPLSGMGTTLSLVGAYNLAGCLFRHSNDYSTAFADYEAKMRPTVTRAQKLSPGMPRGFNPETEWGILALHCIMWFICWSGLAMLMFRLVGPPANNVTVEEYGFRELPEWTPEKEDSSL